MFRHGLILPIPEGHNRDLSLSSNYRGITLLPVISKVFEKTILNRLSHCTDRLHPLQGGFRPNLSCNHSSFILQESILSIQEQKGKAYVAFLDVQKAFDTVWHSGLFYKMTEFNIPPYLWLIIHDWYKCSTSSVFWNSSISRPFPIQQGVRQGSILSPLLYSIYVDNLILTLEASGYGTSINNIYCGAIMYADDLALISDSPQGLQSMLDIVSIYADEWRYKFNASKSAILVFGESPSSRRTNRPARTWHISRAAIPEKDTHKHLGILRTVSQSNLPRIIKRCKAGRSAFFALNAVGSRFGCLHPLTSLKLYKSLCLPVMLFGCELWSPNKTEIIMLERTHRKILRTITGLPTRCNSKALLQLVGMPSITTCIHQRQLSFLHSFSTLPPEALPRQLLEERLSHHVNKGIIPYLRQTIHS